MSHPFFTSEFSIYKMSQANNLYIAIPQAFARIVRECVMEYKSLISVPADKKVKGIVLKDLNELPQNNLQSVDVSINQLRFDV